MILEKIRINNIRSYVHQEIAFPKGHVLLSGNVGAGKSTILLAVEFALFGSRRPGLSGASLLRNGEKSGYVEMDFLLGATPVTIRRTLKRENGVVTQDSGFLSISGKKQNLTPIELKQRILELLNYPKEFLTKSKSLVYRYTVYTPQEQMKEILTEGKDLRLDTLRRIFGVDKYKAIRENSRIFTSAIKERKKELQGYILDLPEKIKLSSQKKSIKKELESQLSPVEKSITLLSKTISEKNSKLLETEKKVEQLTEARHQLEMKKAESESRKQYLKKTRKDDESLLSLTGILQQEIGSKTLEGEESLLEELRETREKILSKESSLEKVRREMEQFKAELRVSRGVMKGISELSSCPTCRQRVTDEHKKGIIKTEQEKTKILDGKIEFLQGEEQQLLQEIQSLKLSLEVLQKKQSSYAVLRVKLQNLCEKKEQHEKNLGEISFLSLQIDSLDVSIFEISRKIQQMEQADIVEYNKIKQQISRFEQDLKTLELQKSSLQATLRAVDGEISLLEREIDKKTQSRIKLEYLSSLLYWMENNFLPLTEAMEKRVMEKINLDFSELFRKWFTLLMDSEAIQSSLDREFTPIITQNNYEIDYAHLSGGEKTAAALAYRLSLNHVINNLMSDIKTNDLLILDEPTDGFSEQQLERIRDVLEELQVAQVIIVSHESKIESFVEHILRVEKENHVSKVLLVG